MNCLTRDVWRRLDAGDVSRNKYLMKKEIVSPVVESVTDVNLDNIVLDLVSALDGGHKIQDDWIAYWNEIKDGRVMASFADYYLAAKSGDASLISSLRDDFKNKWIVCSDRIVYDRDSLDATIISYFGSTNVKPIERKVHIPYYYGVSLDSVLSDPLGLKYFQSLFRTSDGVDVIKSTLFDLSGVSSGEIRVRTPTQEYRSNDSNRVTSLGHYSGHFHVFGSLNLIITGRSRGVRFK